MGPKVFLSHIPELLAWSGVNGFEALVRGKTPAVDAYVWLHELVYSYPGENRDGWEFPKIDQKATQKRLISEISLFSLVFKRRATGEIAVSSAHRESAKSALFL